MRFRFSFSIIFVLLISVFCGCATDNEFLQKTRLFPRRSDRIPGLINPRERSKIIQEKAEKVAQGSEQDRNIVVAQLILEYRSTHDPNLRKETVVAIAKIPHPQRVEHLKTALHDENADVRIAAAKGLVRNIPDNQGLSEDIEHTFRHLILSDPDKDVKITAIQSLKKAGRKCAPETLDLLEKCLSDKTLVVRYEAMDTLKICTGKDFGPNIDRWLAYFQSKRGETVPQPKERTLAEKMPRPRLSMW